MIESPYHSFLNSEPCWSPDLGLGEGGSECSMDLASGTGDLDVTESLFTSLLDDKNVDVDNCSASGNESDDMFHYLGGRRKISNLSKAKGKSAVDEDFVDVVDLSEDRSKIGSEMQVSDTAFNDLDATDTVDDNSVITLYANDLPRDCLVACQSDKQKNRSRPPLMSSGPTLVVRVPRIDSKFPIPQKYRRENSVGNGVSSSATKMTLNRVKKSNSLDEAFSSDAKSSKCMSKNAITARQLREKKKKYVQELEDAVETLKSEKNDLESKYTKQCSHVKSMEKEVQYLRNVIANQTTIGALLNNIHKTPGISIASSLKSSNKRKTLDENDNQENTVNGIYVRAPPRNKKIKKTSDDETQDLQSSTLPEEPSGVCLHVANNHVSLEFCSQCAGSASGAWKTEAKSDARMPLKAVKANIITRNRC